MSRFGMWRTMLVGILLFAVAAVAAANSPNFGLLFASRFAAGASFAFWMISRHAFIAGAVPTRHRGKALSLYGGVGRIAAIIGPILGGVLAEYVDIRAPFYAQAVIAVLTGVFVLYAMKRYGGDTVDPQGHRNVVASIGSTVVLHRKDFMTAGLVAIILQFIRAAREFLIPVWGDEIGLKTDQIGYVASVSYGGGLDDVPNCGLDDGPLRQEIRWRTGSDSHGTRFVAATVRRRNGDAHDGGRCGWAREWIEQRIRSDSRIRFGAAEGSR